MSSTGWRLRRGCCPPDPPYMNFLLSAHGVETAHSISHASANEDVQILLVEDDDLIRQMLSRVLLASGYKVDVAEDGEAGRAALQWGNYDLLITDHNMPKLTGVGLVQKLWSARMSLPVILMSGAMPREDLETHSWLEFVALLAKPFSTELLLATVRTALHSPAHIRQPAEHAESMLPHRDRRPSKPPERWGLNE